MAPPAPDPASRRGLPWPRGEEEGGRKATQECSPTEELHRRSSRRSSPLPAVAAGQIKDEDAKSGDGGELRLLADEAEHRQQQPRSLIRHRQQQPRTSIQRSRSLIRQCWSSNQQQHRSIWWLQNSNRRQRRSSNRCQRRRISSGEDRIGGSDVESAAAELESMVAELESRVLAGSGYFFRFGERRETRKDKAQIRMSGRLDENEEHRIDKDRILCCKKR
ncbi:unnamed protein product [Urochloa humidicola]